MSEEELEQFDLELGMGESSDDLAQQQLKAYQEAHGMTFDNPDAPVAPDDNALARGWARTGVFGPGSDVHVSPDSASNSDFQIDWDE